MITIFVIYFYTNRCWLLWFMSCYTLFGLITAREKNIVKEDNCLWPHGCRIYWSHCNQRWRLCDTMPWKPSMQSCALRQTDRQSWLQLLYVQGQYNGLTWINNHKPSNAWDEITDPFANFNGCKMADICRRYMFKCIFMTKSLCILFPISLAFVPNVQIDYRSALVQVKASIDPDLWCHMVSPGNITMTSQWARRRLKSPASPLFTQPFIRAQIKENIKAPRHWPLWVEFTGDRWIPRTNDQ